MKKDVNKIMESIPEPFRKRWCGGENGPCFCMGCVQVANRSIMVKEYRGDPEWIDEAKIPKDVYDKYKITKDEWLEWMKNN